MVEKKSGAEINKSAKATNKPPQQPKAAAKKRSVSKKKAVSKKAQPISDNKLDMIAETCLGDTMEAMLKPIKKMQMGWKAQTEADQKKVINEIGVHARQLITDIIKLVSSTKHDTIVVQIEDKITIKDSSVVGAVSFRKTEKNMSEFVLEWPGNEAVLMLVDPRKFLDDGVGIPQADKDQPDLPLNKHGDGEDHAAA